MIVKDRRCRHCGGQLYLESDLLQGCSAIKCLLCSREVGTIHRDRVPAPVNRGLLIEQLVDSGVPTG
jgi:hypothetical protein